MIDAHVKDLIDTGGSLFCGSGRTKVTREPVRPLTGVKVPDEHEASGRRHEVQGMRVDEDEVQRGDEEEEGGP